MDSTDLLTALREEVREAAASRVWSQGVTLAREDRVVGKSSRSGEIEVEVRVPARPTPFTVVLYTSDGEWECDCPSKERACAHVVAAVLAVEQAGQLPVSQSVGGRISYRLEVAPGGLNLERRVVHADGREEVLAQSLQSIIAGRIAGPAIAAQEVDIVLDQLLASRPGAVLSGDKLARLLAVLADAGDVRLGGAPIKTSGELVLPRAIVDDAGDGVRVTITRDPAVTEVVSLGVVRCGDLLRPVGEQDLGGGKLEKLPTVREIAAADVGEFVTRGLPA